MHINITSIRGKGCLTPVLICFLIVTSCDEEKIVIAEEETGENITLKDKPLGVIKSSIKGEWQLHYSLGGITGKMRKNHSNSFMDFKSGDSIYWVYEGEILADTTINWIRTRDILGDTTHIMKFYDLPGYPHAWGVERIKEDTLLLYENYEDGMSRFLTRINSQ